MCLLFIFLVSTVSHSSFSLLLCHRLEVNLHWRSQCVCGPGLYSLWSLFCNGQCGLLQMCSILLLHHQWWQSREGRAYEAYAGCTTGWEEILAWPYAGRKTHIIIFMHCTIYIKAGVWNFCLLLLASRVITKTLLRDDFGHVPHCKTVFKSMPAERQTVDSVNIY